MNLNLENKNALVCGSTQGIGKAAAIHFAHHGAKVVVSDINLENAKKVADLINDYIKDEKLKISNIEKAIEYTNQHFSPTQFKKNILDIFKIILTSK